jgi:exo-1,4-beta-D-glucosaminidase
MRPRELVLNKDWQLQSSAKVGATGDVVSTPASPAVDWYPITLPATVLGALVDAGVYPDVFAADNLRRIPGQGPFAQNFSNHPMPDDSPFNVPWWYRKEILVPEDAPPYLRLRFDGINYRANVWLNGERIASHDDVAGAYRVFELDVTGKIRRDQLNVLAVDVTAPTACELGITWVDWNPSPPDKNMGLWRDVTLLATGAVALSSSHVTTRLEGHGRAHLTVGGDLINLSDEPQLAVVEGEIDDRPFAKTFELAPRQKRRFEITGDDAPALVIDNPRLWWPRQLGEPALYDLTISVATGGRISDADRFQFGIREVVSELTAQGHTLFRINGEPLLIRGAGWATDLFLRRNPERDRAELEYVKAMNLNTIRFEGMLERNEFLEWCDRDGILVIAGWCCCDCWEKWDKWNDECHSVAPESLRSQVRRTRRHPSLITWWYGSDFPPPPEVERRYLDILDEERWPNPAQSSAANKPTPLTGPSGLKMEGPYEYVPPNYWLEDKVRGGAWGFATEVCPGVAVPPIESIRKMVPDEHLWPIGEMWDFHAGGQEFHTLKRFVDAMTGRYGAPTSAEDFAQWSQVITFEAQRSMFEAYARTKYVATGVIQWMLNNAWPSMIWHLYDHFLRPAGGYFGTRKACEPLHIQYAETDRTVVVANDHRRNYKGLAAQIRVFDLDMTLLFKRTVSVDVEARGRTDVVTLPELPESRAGSGVHFVDLRLFSANGEPLSQNFYWLAKEPDVIDWEKASWIHTPVARHADLTALRQLPSAPVQVTAARVANGDEAVMVEVRNPGDKLAFFVQARLTDDRGADVLPVVWSDNYVSVLPGERTMLRAVIPGHQGLPADVRVEVSGINVPAQVVSPTPTVSHAAFTADETRPVWTGKA